MTSDSTMDQSGVRYSPTPFPAFDVEDRFHGTNVDVTVSEFWSWGFSDVRDNALRGVLAEFLVAKALGINLGVRQSWDSYDLQMDDGTTIEVKSSGYLQSWAQARHSQIAFSGLKARNWSSKSGYSVGREYRADLFIFGVQTASEHDRYDRLDVNQWEWWVAPRQVVEERGSRNITLGTVRNIAAGPVLFDNLLDVVERVRDGHE
jgi:hypothetical protein